MDTQAYRETWEEERREGFEEGLDSEWEVVEPTWRESWEEKRREQFEEDLEGEWEDELERLVEEAG
jgi:hypothetical protein